jgi:thioredoxin reductase
MQQLAVINPDLNPGPILRLTTAGAVEFMRFIGAGVYYGAAMSEANTCTDAEVLVVGGANSAGQAAMCRASSRPATCVPVRRSALRPRSARARRRWA